MIERKLDDIRKHELVDQQERTSGATQALVLRDHGRCSVWAKRDTVGSETIETLTLFPYGSAKRRVTALPLVKPE